MYIVYVACIDLIHEQDPTCIQCIKYSTNGTCIHTCTWGVCMASNTFYFLILSEWTLIFP